jgi:hypothetical protein
MRTLAMPISPNSPASAILHKPYSYDTMTRVVTLL